MRAPTSTVKGSAVNLTDAQDAEAMGLSAAWVAERHDLKEAAVLVGAVAASTTYIRVSFGSSAAVSRHPVVNATRPVERSTDQRLTRTLTRRGKARHVPSSPADIGGRLARIPAQRAEGDFVLSGLSRSAAGGASKEQFRVELTWTGSEVKRHEQLILRMNPPESPVGMPRTREFEILDAVRGVLWDWTTHELPSFERPQVGMLSRQWLRRLVLDHVSLVHGGYRNDNFLIDEKVGRITAVLAGSLPMSATVTTTWPTR